jgi:hypothetical protein
MRRLHNTIALAFASLTILAAAQTPAEPTDLTKLRDSWQRAIQQANAPLDKKYEEALVAMKTRFTKDGKLQEALAVDNELKLLASRAPAKPGTDTPTKDRVQHQWSMGPRSSFHTARKLAETEGKRLPMLKTESDQRSFMKFMLKTAPSDIVWLDAEFDEVSMKWVWGDKTPIEYANWGAKEPTITKGAVIQIRASDGKWGATTPGRELITVFDDPK